MSRRNVVVTGLGAVSPCGSTMEATWSALIAGKSGIDLTTGMRTDDLRCKVSGQCRDFSAEKYVEAKTIRHNGRFIHMALASAQMAIEHAWDPLESTCRHASLSIL